MPKIRSKYSEPKATCVLSVLLHSPNDVQTFLPTKTRNPASHVSITPYNVWIRHDGVSRRKYQSETTHSSRSVADCMSTGTQIVKTWTHKVLSIQEMPASYARAVQRITTNAVMTSFQVQSHHLHRAWKKLSLQVEIPIWDTLKEVSSSGHSNRSSDGSNTCLFAVI